MRQVIVQVRGRYIIAVGAMIGGSVGLGLAWTGGVLQIASLRVSVVVVLLLIWAIVSIAGIAMLRMQRHLAGSQALIDELFAQLIAAHDAIVQAHNVHTAIDARYTMILQALDDAHALHEDAMQSVSETSALAAEMLHMSELAAAEREHTSAALADMQRFIEERQLRRTTTKPRGRPRGRLSSFALEGGATVDDIQVLIHQLHRAKQQGGGAFRDLCNSRDLPESTARDWLKRYADLLNRARETDT